MRFTHAVNQNLPLLAVDLGYSHRQKSCGIAHDHLMQRLLANLERRSTTVLVCSNIRGSQANS